ncbi:MAG: SynChlorMet cassette protein ScmD [Candidatus Aminicenantes bacterium]|nr:SynChlorMet cassette protein ScmD [Candidatus Aminicenantes bacterium]
MSEDKPIANPQVILREEFDDWAVLFDPDTAHGFALNPVGVLIWKLLDGKHGLGDIVRVVRESCQDVPEDVEGHCREFIDSLVQQGLAGFEMKNA